MWSTDRALAVLVVAGIAWAIVTSSYAVPVKGIATAAIVIVLLVAGFWQGIIQRLPSVLRVILVGAQGVVTHPVVTMLVLLGLVAAAYATGQRYYLIALFLALVLLVPPKLRWRALLRRPRLWQEGPAQDLLSALEVIEGSPKAGPDGPSVVELPSGKTARNTFVLVRGNPLHDPQVEFDAILRPNAILNVVLRYDQATQSGYMLRLDSRKTASEFDAILVMRNGTWGNPIHLSQLTTPSDR